MIRNKSPGRFRPSTLPLGHEGSPQKLFRAFRDVFIHSNKSLTQKSQVLNCYIEVIIRDNTWLFRCFQAIFPSHNVLTQNTD